MIRPLLSTGLAFLCMSCSSAAHINREPAATGRLKTSYTSIQRGKETLELRIGVQAPKGIILGDVLFIHGFGDRLDNHGPLFKAWNEAGLRVIAFDLPSHGENQGSGNDLNHFDFQDLADLVARVESETRAPEKDRPLILSGWSTGGLLAVRMMQTGWIQKLSRKPAGLVLFAPGVSVRKSPWTFGDGWGHITEETLTHDPNPPHIDGIKPGSPFWNKLVVGFSPILTMNSVISQTEAYPSDIPTLFWVGGDKEDRYAKSQALKEWASDRNEERRSQGKAPIITIQCPHGMHELDNESPAYGGVEVRDVSARYSAAFARGETSDHWPKASLTICKPF